MRFWRVLNWNPAANTAEDNGHPLYVWPRQGAGRVDDSQREYLVLYVGDSPMGAVAEAFGRFIRWTPAILEAPKVAPSGTIKALVAYDGEPDVLDLDDPYTLVDWGLRPSQVVARDRPSTQRWARAIYDAGGTAGVSWWSYYEPRWASIGLWDISGLTPVGDPEPLTLDHPVIHGAAEAIRRIVEVPSARRSRGTGAGPW
ncbi:RES domain-containing protein [Arthrobacter sp. Marseille-P9274]|uniref:RES domain-containing protein n=1 Tax=Arthrobacter sp. Marseille-P9274 TaxID=2866572 RepID=UPI0021C72162|nr:RES domain-containing protein [Arthrobacter sp. Marseille-P9274]